MYIYESLNRKEIIIESWGGKIVIDKTELEEFIEDLKSYLED